MSIVVGLSVNERCPETYGLNNEYDYGMRMYNPRLGRFMSVDPWTQKYPWQSSYCGLDNNPILKIDPTGGGAEDWVEDKNGKIKWDDNATSQATTQKGEKYLGKVVVEFKGSRDEKLGKKDGRSGYINGEGAKTAKVTVYGAGGANDVHTFTGYTMTSDATEYGAIDEGLYEGNYDEKGKGGTIESNWVLNYRGNVREKDGGTNPNAPSQVDENGEGYKNQIFIHSTNNNGYAGILPKTEISSGCLLIAPSDWSVFNNIMNGYNDQGYSTFKVQISRQVTEIVPVQGINGPVDGVNYLHNIFKIDH